MLIAVSLLWGYCISAFYVGHNGMGNEILDCGRGAPFLPSPYDRHSFYRCFTTTSAPVQMSCGFLMFNPLLSTCDWPSNTIRVRQECGSSYSYFSSKPDEKPGPIPKEQFIQGTGKDWKREREPIRNEYIEGISRSTTEKLQSTSTTSTTTTTVTTTTSVPTTTTTKPPLLFNEPDFV